MIDDDIQVVRFAHAGDLTRALGHLMEHYGERVYRFCRAALRDSALADDVRQQVFIQAYRDLPRFEGRSSVRHWLFAIARHRVIDAQRARRRNRAWLLDDPPPELVETPDPGPSAAESIDDMRLRWALAASLNDLNEHSKVAVLLRCEGLSFHEMARVSGDSPGALHARVTRALHRLREGVEARIDNAPLMRELRRAAPDSLREEAPRAGFA